MHPRDFKMKTSEKVRIKIPSQIKTSKIKTSQIKTVQSIQKTDIRDKNNENGLNKRDSKSIQENDEACNMLPNELLLDSFLNPEINLKISVPIPFKIVYEDEMYFLENDLLEIFSFDKSLKKAREVIELQLLTLWNDYVMEDEASLSKSSLLYKKLLLKYLEAKDD